MQKHKWGLRQRMMFITVGIPLLFLVPVFVYVGIQYRNASRSAYFGKGDLVARELKQTLETVAPYVQTLDDAPGLSKLLQNMSRDVEEFEFITLVAESGLVIESSQPGIKGTVVQELINLRGDGKADRRNFPTGPLYLISRQMPLPGVEDQLLYIVVAEKADVVDPNLVLPVLVIIVGIVISLSLVHFSMSNLVLRPLHRLAEGTAIVGAGDLSYKIALYRQDEFGLVADAFNEMAEHLRELVTRLEQRVEVRTAALERKTVQLEAISLVSKEAAQVRNVNMVLDTAVNAISEKFEFYHTGIFILDDEKQWAILRAASSEGGQRMLARGHRLAVGQVGIVGYVSDTGKPRIAFDVGGDAVWFNNPDLPETRSEMSLPLKVEEEVIGVLDVQSDQPQAFTDEDISTLQLMADQLAIAVQNARTLEMMEGALEELRQVQIDYTRDGWARMMARTRTLAYEYDRVDTNPVPPLPVPTDLRQGRVTSKVILDGGAPVVMEAMRAGDRVVGYLGLSDPDRVWSDEELELISSVTDQVALALDNARLFEEAQRNERQQVLISRVLQVAANPDITAEQVLPEIARILAQGLNMAVGIFTFLLPDVPLVYPHAVMDEKGATLPFFDQEFSLPEEHHLFLRGLNHPELGPMLPLLHAMQAQQAEAQHETEAILDHPLLGVYNFSRVLYVPISSGGAQGGFLAMIQQQGDAPLDPDTRDLAQNLANQIGVVIDNLNLSEQTRQRAEEFSLLYRAGIDLLGILEVKDLLEKAADWAREILDAPSSVVFLKDQETGVYTKGQSADSPERLPGDDVASPSENGLTEVIINNREDILVRDNREYATAGNSRLIAAGLLSQIGVPLVVGDEVLGAIFVHGTEVAQFGEDDRRLLEFLSTQVAAALQNALQLSVVERQARYQTNISEAVALLAQDGTEALESVLALLGEAAEVDRVYYAESFEQSSGTEYEQAVGAYWRLVAGWTNPAFENMPEDTLVQTLPMEKFSSLIQRIREHGFAQMMLSEFTPEAQDLLAASEIKSLLALAVTVEDRLPSFLGFAGMREERFLSTDEVSALQTAAAALSNTLARENLLNRVRTALSEQEALYQASAELNAVSTYQGILEVLHQHTILGQNSVDITINYFDRPWINGEHPEWVEVLARWTQLPDEVLSDRYPFTQLSSADQFLREMPTVVEHIADDPRLDEPLRSLYVETFQVHSAVFVPLIAGGQRIGFLNALYVELTTFSEQEMRRLTSLAGQAAIGIQNIQQLRISEARARRERMIREITEQIQRAPDVEGVLRTGLRELGRAFGTSRSVVQFRQPSGLDEEEEGPQT